MNAKSLRQNLLLLAFCIYAVTTFISMAVMNIGFGILFLAILYSWGGVLSWWQGFLEELRRPAVRVLFQLSVILCLACFVSLFFARINPVEILGHSVQVSFPKDVLKLWYLFLPFIILTGLKKLSSQNRKRVLQVWLIALGVIAIFGISQYFYGWSWMRSRVIPALDPNRFHVDLWLGHHLSVASILIFPVFAALDFALRRKGPSEIDLRRSILILIAVLGTVALFLTYSRMLWISLLFGLFAITILSLPRKLSVMAAIGIILVVAGATQHPDIKKRIFESSGFNDRKQLWDANFYYFRQRPLTGVGFRKSQSMSEHYIVMKNPKAWFIFSGHAHNNLIEMIGGTGLLGALAWVAWVFGSLWIVWLCFRSRPPPRLAFPLGVAVAWAVFHLNGLTQVNFWEGKVAHQTMWIMGWTLLWVPKREARKK